MAATGSLPGMINDWFSSLVVTVLVIGLTILLFIEGDRAIAAAFVILDLCLCGAWWIVFRNDFSEWRKKRFNRD